MKQPKIFLTRLPLNELQDPEIFFTKIIKENDSSVEIVPSDLRPDQLDALAHSPSLMFEEVPNHQSLANAVKILKYMARCEFTREKMDLLLKKVKTRQLMNQGQMIDDDEAGDTDTDK